MQKQNRRSRNVGFQCYQWPDISIEARQIRWDRTVHAYHKQTVGRSMLEQHLELAIVTQDV